MKENYIFITAKETYQAVSLRYVLHLIQDGKGEIIEVEGVGRKTPQRTTRIKYREY